MENNTRYRTKSLIEKLKDQPWDFSLDIAIHTFKHYYKNKYTFEKSCYKFIAFSNNLDIQAHEIGKITTNCNNQNLPIIYSNRLSLMGMNSPLSTNFTQRLLTNYINHDFAMYEFLNIFYAKLIHISHKLSIKENLALQPNPKDSNITKILNFFIGHGDTKLNAFLYLFWSSPKSSIGLQTILESYLNTNVIISQFQPVKIAHNLDFSLGEKTKLSEFLLGTKICDPSVGVSIKIGPIDFNQAKNLIDNRRICFKDSILSLIKNYVRKPLHYQVTICLSSIHNSFLGNTNLNTTMLTYCKQKKNSTQQDNIQFSFIA